MGWHALLQGVFPTQGSNPRLMSPVLGGGFFTTGAIWEALHLGSFNRSLVVFPPSPSLSEGSRRGIVENSGQLRAIPLLET